MKSYTIGEKFEDFLDRVEKYALFRGIQTNDMKIRLFVHSLGKGISTLVMNKCRPMSPIDFIYERFVKFCKKEVQEWGKADDEKPEMKIVRIRNSTEKSWQTKDLKFWREKGQRKQFEGSKTKKFCEKGMKREKVDFGELHSRKKAVRSNDGHVSIRNLRLDNSKSLTESQMCINQAIVIKNASRNSWRNWNREEDTHRNGKNISQYRNFRKKQDNLRFEERRNIPENLKLLHGNHEKAYKRKKLASKRIYWIGLCNDIDKPISGCEFCQNKTAVEKPACGKVEITPPKRNLDVQKKLKSALKCPKEVPQKKVKCVRFEENKSSHKSIQSKDFKGGDEDIVGWKSIVSPKDYENPEFSIELRRLEKKILERMREAKVVKVD